MKEIKLSYDAYRMEASCADGSMKDFFAPKFGKIPLDKWCNDFLIEVVKNENSNVCVELSALERDCETMEDAVEAYNEQNSDGFKITFKANIQKSIATNSNVSQKLKKLNDIYSRVKEDSCPFEELKNNANIDRNFQKAQDQEYEIAVVATMSSGKSTLINAMLGRELLPARNEATTATIAKIYNTNIDHYSATSYDADMNLLDSKDPLGLDDMNILNNNPNTAYINIKGKISGISTDGLNLILSDTPGPNNSRTKEHEKHTYKLIKDADYKPMVLYILNATQLEIQDDRNLLKDISEAMRSGGREGSDRFIFVLNKADEFDPEKGETIAKKIEDTKKYLEKEGIKDPKIFPCASRLAKLIRQDLNGETLSSKEKSSLRGDVALFVDEPNYHFSDFAPLSDSARAKINEQLKAAKEHNSEKEEALIYTGIPAVEAAISEHLEKYALPKKITEILHSFSTIVKNLEIEAKELSRLNSSKSKIEKTRKAINEINAQLSNGKKSDELKARIDALSVSDDVKRDLEKLTGKKTREFLDILTRKYKGNLPTNEAKIKIGILKNEIEEFGNKFAIDIEMLLNTKIGDEAGKYVDEYNRYVVDLVGSAFKHDVNPAAILGSLVTISFEADSSDYEETITEEVGTHIETRTRTVYQTKTKKVKKAQGGFFGGLMRGFGSIFGNDDWGYDEDYEEYEVPVNEEYDVEVTDYEKRKYVDLGRLAMDKGQEYFEKVTQHAQKLALEQSIEEERKLKNNFKEAFDAVNIAIQKKMDDLDAKLGSEKELEKAIEESNKKLVWLNNFETDIKKALVS
ncbi:ATP/GTP binding protein [Campylobacter devanensis]|uniref:Dynamin family protein n=1 Tax=Campylobacter devanensis TaxID=3161138 RepID=A0A1X9SRW7_9BACT|nr:dynamin family protein [Campylobacter lanienae]ARQ98962.1 dynamin family protein [Campylobacter lanienae]SUX02032.1 ATP/GTP binding protein [Campylobacter lanienae]